MKFRLIESDYINWEEIHDEFTDDYLFSDLSNQEIRLKYDMTHGDFKECCQLVKEENNISRRPFWKHRKGNCKYYYPTHNGYQIRKIVQGKDTYFGFVPSERIAQILVKLCILASWDIPVCKDLCDNWRDYLV